MCICQNQIGTSFTKHICLIIGGLEGNGENMHGRFTEMQIQRYWQQRKWQRDWHTEIDNEMDLYKAM